MPYQPSKDYLKNMFLAILTEIGIDAALIMSMVMFRSHPFFSDFFGYTFVVTFCMIAPVTFFCLETRSKKLSVFKELWK